MESRVQTGYLVLADISGYTSYLAASELDHAHEILAELIGAVIGALSPRLTVAEVEGDAVFAYAPASAIARGESLVELIEAAFVSFRDRRDGMRRMTSSVCRACQQIGSLDLKFVTHFGSYVLQSYSGALKPLGSDVNLAHRLLKNGVETTTGWRGYSLYSQAAAERLELPSDAMHRQEESYDHLGTVTTLSSDLEERLAALRDQRRVVVSPEQAFARMEYEFPHALDTVWDWMAMPERKGEWVAGTRWTRQARPQGRTAPGAINHCHHGKKGVMPEEILDWRPREYYTSRNPMGPMGFVMTMRLSPTTEGTRVDATFGLDGPLPRWLRRRICTMIVRSGHFDESWKRLDDLIEQERIAMLDTESTISERY